MKRLRKRAPLTERQLRAKRRRAEALAFDEERRALFAQLQAYAAECDERDPVRFLVFLRQQKRGYDKGHDGKSKFMQLVDDIDALDERERKWAEGRLTKR